MSDRPILDSEARIRVRGDAALAATLCRALDDEGLPLWRPGDPRPTVEVWWRRGALLQDTAEACRRVLERGGFFLPIASEWGAAALGPLSSGRVGEPCALCCEPPAAADAHSARPAELVPLPEMVAALATEEIALALTGRASNLVGAQLFVTPYANWGLASPPLWFRRSVAQSRACPICRERSTAGPPSHRPEFQFAKSSDTPTPARSPAPRGRTEPCRSERDAGWTTSS